MGVLLVRKELFYFSKKNVKSFSSVANVNNAGQEKIVINSDPSSTSTSRSTSDLKENENKNENEIKKLNKIYAGLILSRPNLITPGIDKFSKAYYNYQKELEKRMMWSFPQQFYFKFNSIAEREFNLAQKRPNAGIRDVYYSRGKPDIRNGRDRFSKQEIIVPKAKRPSDNSNDSNNDDGDELTKPIFLYPRITEADKLNDYKSLSRSLDKTIYLLIKYKGEKNYTLPFFEISRNHKYIDRVVEDGLRNIGGENMNTWLVAKKPAMMYQFKKENNDVLSKIYYLKSHIFAGQFVIQDNNVVDDFLWLNKDEIDSKIDNHLYEKLKWQLY